MSILNFIRCAKVDAWLAGDVEAYEDWRDAEFEELVRAA